MFVTVPIRLPDCIALEIRFNEHAVNYETVESWIANNAITDWVSATERDKSSKENSVWGCVWNPRTPVGSCALYASSLQALLEGLQEYL